MKYCDLRVQKKEFFKRLKRFGPLTKSIESLRRVT